MTCKHCGKELIAVTLYMEASYLNTAAPAPTYLPVELGHTYIIPNAAAASCVPNTFTLCIHAPVHEPASAIVDTTTGQY